MKSGGVCQEKTGKREKKDEQVKKSVIEGNFRKKQAGQAGKLLV